MDKIYALIKNNKVENTIVAEQNFIDSIQNQYDYCIRIDQIDTPCKWIKDNEQDVFENPNDETWTYVPGIQRPSIGRSYDGSNFSEPQE